MGAFTNSFSRGFGVQQGALLNRPPSVLYDGNTVAWFDYTKTNTITKDGSNSVSRWNDVLGSGRDLLQTKGGNQPILTDSGILFDGVSSFLYCNNFTYNQPEFIYIVLKQITWTSSGVFLNGNGVDSGALYQYTSSPKIMAYCGGNIILNGNLQLDNYAIIRLLFNGANSKLIVNDTSPTTGNFGSSNMGGFRLGNSHGGVQLSNIEVKEVILRNISDTQTSENNIYNYLKKKYSL